MNKLILKIIAISLTIALLLSLCACANGKKGAGLVKNPKLEESTYKSGDFMGDYTITDLNGNTYNFGQILKDKEAIVLNFWFSNCDPCKNEFPYLQKAAKTYSDDIMVFAINPVDEKEEKIKKFVTENNITIPVIKGDPAWEKAFSIKGYPTTVVIDRYGSIALSHIGSITEDGKFEKIFEFFSSDDYEQTVVKNIDDIK